MTRCPFCRALLTPIDRTCPACRAPVDRDRSSESGTTSASVLTLMRQTAEAFGIDTSSPLGAVQSIRRLYQDAQASDRSWTYADGRSASGDDFWKPGTAARLDGRKAAEMFDMLMHQVNALVEQRANRFQSIRDEMLERCAEALRDRRR